MELFHVTECSDSLDFSLTERSWVETAAEELDIMRIRTRTPAKEQVNLVNACRIQNTKAWVAFLQKRTSRLMVKMNDNTEVLQRAFLEQLSLPSLKAA